MRLPFPPSHLGVGLEPTQLTGLEKFVLKLEDIIRSEKFQASPVVDLERNFTLRGSEYLLPVYEAIINRQVLSVWYQSFKAKRAGKIIFVPYFIKEFRNRFYVIGAKYQGKALLNLAFDRIEDIEIEKDMTHFTIEEFEPNLFFNNTIGITTIGQKPVNVHLLLNHQIAPYIISKPIHHTQQIISESDAGVEIAIQVVHNLELEREILSYGEQIRVLAPESLRQSIIERLLETSKFYGII